MIKTRLSKRPGHYRPACLCVPWPDLGYLLWFFFGQAIANRVAQSHECPMNLRKARYRCIQYVLIYERA